MGGRSDCDSRGLPSGPEKSDPLSLHGGAEEIQGLGEVNALMINMGKPAVTSQQLFHSQQKQFTHICAIISQICSQVHIVCHTMIVITQIHIVCHTMTVNTQIHIVCHTMTLTKL